MNNRVVFFLTVLFLLVASGCAHNSKSGEDKVEKRLSNIIAEDKAGVAILLGADGKVSTVSLFDGERLPICGAQGSKPCLRPKTKDDILHEEVIKITFVRGSLCAQINVGGRVTQKCSPEDGPYPEAYIMSLLPSSSR